MVTLHNVCLKLILVRDPTRPIKVFKWLIQALISGYFQMAERCAGIRGPEFFPIVYTHWTNAAVFLLKSTQQVYFEVLKSKTLPIIFHARDYCRHLQFFFVFYCLLLEVWSGGSSRCVWSWFPCSCFWTLNLLSSSCSIRIPEITKHFR